MFLSMIDVKISHTELLCIVQCLVEEWKTLTIFLKHFSSGKFKSLKTLINHIQVLFHPTENIQNRNHFSKFCVGAG